MKKIILVLLIFSSAYACERGKKKAIADTQSSNSKSATADASADTAGPITAMAIAPTANANSTAKIALSAKSTTANATAVETKAEGKENAKLSVHKITTRKASGRKLIADTVNGTAQIPIVAILAIPENLTNNLSRYKELKASGVTESYYSFSSADAMQAALDMGQKVGLKLFVACPELTRDPETTVKRFMNHPALAGYFVSDEPSSTVFGKVGDIVKRIRAVDDRHICYVNLFPNYQIQKYMGVSTYREYLDKYVNQVPAQVISFDHYPITGNTKQSIRPMWYQNLQMIADLSKKTGKPFWGFALSVAQVPFPVPSLGALRLQVFSNLAYGAQGIEYFTYWTPATPQFNTAAISKDGHQTEVYHSMQQVNQEIKGLSGVFLGATLVSVAHTNVVPQGGKSLNVLPKQITSLKTDNIGALVSVMKNNGKTYLVVVNHDFTGPMNMTIKCLQGVSRVQKDGTSVSQNQFADKVVTLEAGDVAVYSWPDALN